MIRVLDDRVLVALPPKEHVQETETGYTTQIVEVTESGLIIAKPADVYNVDIATRGIVMQLGEKRGQVDLDDARAEVNELFLDHLARHGRRAYMHPEDTRDEVDRLLMKMAPAKFDVAVGDCVIFPASAGDQFEQDGVQYVVLRESDIIGVVAPKEANAA